MKSQFHNSGIVVVESSVSDLLTKRKLKNTEVAR